MTKCKGKDCPDRYSCDICEKILCKQIEGDVHKIDGHFKFLEGIVCLSCKETYGVEECRRKMR